MECYEGATLIKTYKGILADGGQDRIRLKTNRGDIGYRIVKFQMISETTGTYDYGFVIKIFKVIQPDLGGGVFATATIDFTDGDLLAAGYIENHENIQYPSSQSQIVFENEIFNQDIYITCKDIETGQNCNYYLELEQVKLNENESTMATLQSLRTVASK